MHALALALTLFAVPARAADPSVTFSDERGERLRVTAWDLAHRKDARLVTLTDPFYGKVKRYRAVPVRSLLTEAFGPSWIENGVGEMFFEALDGYKSHAKLPLLAQEGGMLAFEDADAPGWEELPKEKVKPGPFYLVWTGADQTPGKGYPWPWQVMAVTPGIVDDLFPKAVPRNYPLKSRAPAGWAIFRSRCISCHAISGQGGSVGPDLNEPKGITTYHDKKHLKAFIHRASEFRHTKMPDFDELEAKDLDDLMAYFDFIAVQNGTK